MIHFSKYDVVVVQFPFASSSKYKARPAVVISSHAYNNNRHQTLLIMAISSQITTKESLEYVITDWEVAGLLKPSLLKASVATIEREVILQRLGTLSASDAKALDAMLLAMCLEK